MEAKGRDPNKTSAVTALEVTRLHNLTKALREAGNDALKLRQAYTDVNNSTPEAIAKFKAVCAALNLPV